MNIFIVDQDPYEAARALCDRHVTKMSLETAQILCAVSRRYGNAAPYKLTHAKHPSVLWAGETLENWRWLVWHGRGLTDEYTRRYGKTHTSESIIEWCADFGGRPEVGDLTPFAQAMPDEYRRPDAVEAYRAYYRGAKAGFATWRAPALPPTWWEQKT